MSTATKVLGLALAGGVGYWLYEKYLTPESWYGKPAPAPGPGGIVPATQPMPTTPPVTDHTPAVPVTLPPASTPSTPSVADAAAAAAAAAQIRAAAQACAASGGRFDAIANYCVPSFTGPTAPAIIATVLDKTALLAKLQQLGGPGQLTVDDWNYYLQQINPSATVTDLGVARDANDAFYASQYLDLRTSAGLSGLAAAYGRRVRMMPSPTMRFANRRNYVRVA